MEQTAQTEKIRALVNLPPIFEDVMVFALADRTPCKFGLRGHFYATNNTICVRVPAPGVKNDKGDFPQVRKLLKWESPESVSVKLPYVGCAACRGDGKTNTYLNREMVRLSGGLSKQMGHSHFEIKRGWVGQATEHAGQLPWIHILLRWCLLQNKRF
jgi:hypothetical protein